MEKKYHLAILFAFLNAAVFGQNPTCPSPYIYMMSGQFIRAFNTALPVSSTNPFNTTIPSPPGNGLTVMPNIHGGTLSPTFYSTGGGFNSTYYYWSGSSWVNTNASTGNGGINLGGCGTSIFSIVGQSVYVHNVNTNTSTFVTTVQTAVADIVPDCNCNFYIFSQGHLLRKYTPGGSLISTYTLTGLNGFVNGGGYAIVGNNVYCQVGSTLQVGTIGTGSVVSFVPITGTITGGSDWASCSVDLNSVPTTGTIQVNGSPCQDATITATSNSPVTYSWSGPGVPAAQTTSAIVTNSTGVFSCTVFSSGCGAPPTLTLTATPGSNTCISVSSSSITCASLGSATVTAPGIGPFSYTWMPSAQVGSVATGLSPGTYTVTIYDAFANLTTTSSVSFTSLIPLTGTIISTDATCNGQANGTASVTGLSGGSGSQSYQWTNGVNSYSQAGVTNLSAGIWSLTVTDQVTACTFNQVFSITQPPPLTLTLSTSTPTACLGESVVLTGTASGGTSATSNYTYSWTGGAPANTMMVNPLAGTHTHTLTAMDDNSCTISNTIQITIVPNPAVSVASASICPLQTGTLVATGATTYTWNTGVTGNTLIDSPSLSQVYAVTGSALGCTATASGSIILKPLPFITITPSSTICEGRPFTFSAGGGIGFNWNGPQSFNSSFAINNLPAVQLSEAGIYNVTVTAVNSCTAQQSFTLTVKPLPLINIAPVSSSLCTGTSDSVSLAASGTATLYNWMPPSGLSSNNTQTVNARPPSTTIYTVTGTLNSCTAAATATVFLVQPPAPVISLSNGSLCAHPYNGSPNSVTLTAGGGSSYTIAAPGQILVADASGPVTELSVQPPFLPAGITTVTLTASNGVCTRTTSAGLNIVVNPTVTIDNTVPFICSGKSHLFQASGAASYYWTITNSASTVHLNGSTTLANPTVQTLYSVFGSSQGCNSVSDDHLLIVNPLPDLNVNDTLVCLGSSTEIGIRGSAGATYSWSPLGAVNVISNTLVSVSPLQQQTYTITASLNTCTSQALITVSVLTLPVAVISPPEEKYCANDSVIVQASGGHRYQWDGPMSYFSETQALRFKPFSAANSGNYTLTVFDQNNCSGSAMTHITILDPPSGYLNISDKQCVPFCTDVVFEKNPLSASITAMKWQLNNRNYNGASFRECFSKAGEYQVSGSITDANGCTAAIGQIVYAFPKPVADFKYSPIEPREEFDPVTFIPLTAGEVSYSWEINDKNWSSASKEPQYQFERAGNYLMALIVTNEFNCADTVIKEINVVPDFGVYVPNVFTPNNDVLNDLFRPVISGELSFRFSVFNRWGEKLFETSDPHGGWDGSFRGRPCKQDEYIWILTVTSKGRLNEMGEVAEMETKKYRGHVLLYR